MHGAALGLIAPLVALGCRTPTTIDVSVESEVTCAANARAVLVGGSSLADLPGKAPAATSTQCAPQDGGEALLGNLVVLPLASGSDESTAFAVMTRPDGQSAAGCLGASEAPFCIVAKRELRFIPRTELAVRIDLRLSCLGVTCPTDQTCVKGQCKSDQVNENACTPSCDEGTLLPGVDGGAPDAGCDGDAADGAASCTSGPPSCAPGGPGMTSCGRGGAESCCTSLEVPSGTFYRTYTASPDGGAPTGEADPATVSGFRLDELVVTVGRFRQFVNAWKSGYLPAAGSGIHSYLNGGKGLANSASPGTYETGWLASYDSNVDPTDANLACGPPNTWTPTAGASENLPLNCQNWWEAYAFCIWDGGFLPSEAEWEYAAAGGSQQRLYPWGFTDPGSANQYAIYNNYYAGGTIAPVGTAMLGAGRWGQLDLAGNLHQRGLDAWSASFAGPCTDCANLGYDLYYMLRGGAYQDPATRLRPVANPANGPQRITYTGIRCARAP